MINVKVLVYFRAFELNQSILIFLFLFLRHIDFRDYAYQHYLFYGRIESPLSRFVFLFNY